MIGILHLFLLLGESIIRFSSSCLFNPHVGFPNLASRVENIADQFSLFFRVMVCRFFVSSLLVFMFGLLYSFLGLFDFLLSSLFGFSTMSMFGFLFSFLLFLLCVFDFFLFVRSRSFDSLPVYFRDRINNMIIYLHGDLSQVSRGFSLRSLSSNNSCECAR